MDDKSGCGHYKQAWAVQMNKDNRLPGDLNTRKLNFPGCTGHGMTDLRNEQVYMLEPT